ncbi:MAG: aminopeptidase N [Pseudomonadota bacterium]
MAAERDAAALVPDTAGDGTVRLADYRPPAWLVDRVRLDVDLAPRATRVQATVDFRLNPDHAGPDLPPLVLDGRRLTLVEAAVDGRDVTADPGLALQRERLVLDAAALPGPAFTWTCTTEIDPESNTELEGLYLSGGIFCTQCEAEGFRKITYYPDRPDVMAPFTVRLTAPAGGSPVLLSNGNPGASGTTPDGRAFAEWDDPHPKPAYLFALVAGDLVAHRDRFRTAEGREVDLAVWVRPGDQDKCGYAMDALKRSMVWDERAYGRVYDLDVFNIVAVSDFNMGAMENKGLNIFNSKYVLASPETATDRDYELIEGIVAHEYFHNWTGNRITCRDWFQLCLKEGLTVYRDQRFSEDERSPAVGRIDQVKALRARQFPEDGGPLAHPVRPEAYKEINNFYTATIYEKGAEVIRMLAALVGEDGYRKALDLYFERHDGQACTIEQFRACFEDALGTDLAAFARWWYQAGTPRLTVREAWDAEAGQLTIRLAQETPATPGQPEKAPLVLPVRYGLLGTDGADLLAEGEALYVLDGPEGEIVHRDLSARPVLSINRGFSAPVILHHEAPDGARLFLLAHDSDPFNRWEAGRAIALDLAVRMATGQIETEAEAVPKPWIRALAGILDDARLAPPYQALMLEIPGNDEVAARLYADGHCADPDRIHDALRTMRAALGAGLAEPLAGLTASLADSGPYDPAAEPAGRRALRQRCLALRLAAGDAAAAETARAMAESADNMTERLGALTAMVHLGVEGAAAALAAFRADWAGDELVMDKWFSVQATAPLSDAADRAAALTEDPAFTWQRPNRFRAVVAAFAMANPVGFHAASGAGYRFVADWIIRLDAANPQTAARVTGCFESWRRYDDARGALMQAEMRRIAAAPGLSRNTSEIAERLLA